MSRTTARLAVLTLAVTIPAAARAEVPIVPPMIQIANAIWPEGNSGQSAFTTTVSASNYWAYGKVTVRVRATPGTASTNDYVFPDTELTFDGTTTTQTVTGYIVGDVEVEGDETFTLTATLVGDAGVPYMGSSGGVVTIVDDDEPREFLLTVDGSTVREGNLGLSIPVRLQPASPYTVTVAYETRDGSATSGSDYAATAGKLTFAPGDTTRWIAITLVDDKLPEPDETFTVVLSNPTNATLRTATAEVTIRDDDGIDAGIDLAPAVDLARDDLQPALDFGANPIDVSAAEVSDTGSIAVTPDAATVPPDARDAGATTPDAVAVTTPDTAAPNLPDSAPPSGNTDSGPGSRVGGTSGCSCALGGVAAAPPTALLSLLVLAIALTVRRRPRP
jgi:MYXO-CTERM domain-containing protein